MLDMFPYVQTWLEKWQRNYGQNVLKHAKLEPWFGLKGSSNFLLFGGYLWFFLFNFLFHFLHGFS